MKLFHRHKWVLFQGSFFYSALALRVCNCGEEETLMYNFKTKKQEWIKGNFLEDLNAPIFVFAASSHEFAITTKIIQEAGMTDVSFYWAKDVTAIEEIKKFKRPRFVLAKDWNESPIIEHPLIRILFSTGHI